MAEYLPQVSMSEQKLSKRLREVVRYGLFVFFCFLFFLYLSKDVEPFRKISNLCTSFTLSNGSSADTRNIELTKLLRALAKVRWIEGEREHCVL